MASSLANVLAKVLIDANVLYSRTLRDWLLLLAVEGGMYRGYRTEDIIAETIYHLRRDYPQLDGGVLTELRNKLETCLTPIPQYEILADYPGADPNDAHLHSAAVAGGIGYVVTNDGSFTESMDHDDLTYEIYDADSFLLLVDDSSSETVHAVTHRQAEWFIQRHGECHLVDELILAGCPEFADRVRLHLQSLY